MELILALRKIRGCEGEGAAQLVLEYAIKEAVEAERADAERYRWLRAQHWSEAPVCVVARPKDAVRLGYYCPSLDRLDAIIDDARKTANAELRGGPAASSPDRPA